MYILCVCTNIELVVSHSDVLTGIFRVHSMTEKLAQFTDIRSCLIVGGLSPKVLISFYWFFYFLFFFF